MPDTRTLGTAAVLSAELTLDTSKFQSELKNAQNLAGSNLSTLGNLFGDFGRKAVDHLSGITRGFSDSIVAATGLGAAFSRLEQTGVSATSKISKEVENNAKSLGLVDKAIGGTILYQATAGKKSVESMKDGVIYSKVYANEIDNLTKKFGILTVDEIASAEATAKAAVAAAVAAKTTTSLSGAIGGFGSSIAGALGPIGLFITGLLAIPIAILGIKKALEGLAEESIKSEQVAVSFDRFAKSVKLTAGEVDAFKDHATTLAVKMGAIGVSDEEVLQGMTQMSRQMKVNYQDMDQLSLLAGKISLRTGKTYEESIGAITLAYHGFGKALRDIDPSLAKTIQEAKTGQERIELLQKAMGNLEFPDPTSYTEKMKQLGQVWDEIKETLGDVLLPILHSLANALRDFLVTVGSWIGSDYATKLKSQDDVNKQRNVINSMKYQIQEYTDPEGTGKNAAFAEKLRKQLPAEEKRLADMEAAVESKYKLPDRSTTGSQAKTKDSGKTDVEKALESYSSMLSDLKAERQKSETSNKFEQELIDINHDYERKIKAIDAIEKLDEKRKNTLKEEATQLRDQKILNAQKAEDLRLIDLEQQDILASAEKYSELLEKDINNIAEELTSKLNQGTASAFFEYQTKQLDEEIKKMKLYISEKKDQLKIDEYYAVRKMEIADQLEEDLKNQYTLQIKYADNFKKAWNATMSSIVMETRNKWELMADLTKQTFDNIQSSLSNIMEDWMINSSKSMKEYINDFTKLMATSLANITSEYITNSLKEWVFGSTKVDMAIEAQNVYINGMPIGIKKSSGLLEKTSSMLGLDKEDENNKNWLDRINDRIEDKWAEIAEWWQELDFSDSFNNIYDSILEALTNLGDSLSSMLESFSGGGGGFGGLMDMFGGASDLLSGFGDSGLYGMDMMFDFASFHQGGEIGTRAASRKLPSWMLNYAPRLHSGLMAGEFPTILQRGETVIPAGKNRNTEETVIYNIYANDAASFNDMLNRNKASIHRITTQSLKDNKTRQDWQKYLNQRR